jgi:tetratricopeptide (TPR) repeat protein
LLCGLDTPADREKGGPDQRTLHGSAARFLEALARRNPLCLAFEDIHWADDALLDLIEFLTSRVQSAPLLIVTQARPSLLDTRPTWARGLRAFTSLPVEPLGEKAGLDLLFALSRERGLGAEVAHRLGPVAGGNPLFAEELVATALECGSVSELPSSVRLVVQARLDGLAPEERHALQRATVLGKTFWEGGLRALGVVDPIGARLESLERKDLIRAQARSQLRGEHEYIFKHDLIRDVGYETLPRNERHALHGRAIDWLESVGGERKDELLSILAHHAVQAQQPERALEYLTRAAQRAGRASAHREEANLLAQALDVAERAGREDLLASLRARRGRAFASVGLWPAARGELETALTATPPDAAELRAELLVDLSMVSFWALDTPSFRRYATQAVSEAQTLGADELTASAMAWLAEVRKVDGELQASVALYQQALALAGGVRTAPLANAPLLFYLLGRIAEAVTYAREAVDIVRTRHDTSAIMWTLPHLGLALAASGRYAEAAKIFDEAREFGRAHEVWPLLARAVAMSVGFHLDAFDHAGAEQLAEEARDLARSAGFAPSEVSPGIDLLLSYARRGEVACAERLEPAVAEAVYTTGNWHGWLWKLRLAEAHAELALARGDLEGAIRHASDAVEQSVQRGRPKYQVLGLTTRARAQAALGHMGDAITDLRRALSLARPVGDPALLLVPAAALLALEGDEALLTEALRARENIATSLPDNVMRARFEDADPVRTIARLTR